MMQMSHQRRKSDVVKRRRPKERKSTISHPLQKSSLRLSKVRPSSLLSSIRDFHLISFIGRLGIRLPQHHPPHRFPLPHLLLPHLPPLHPHLPRPPTPPHPRPPKPTRPAAHPLLERNAQHHPLPPLLRSLPLRQPRAPRLHARIRRRRA